MEIITNLLKIFGKTDKEAKKNLITVLIGAALGLVIVFSIAAFDLFGDDSVEPSEFVEVTEAGDDINLEQLEELRGLGDLSSILKNWALNTSEKSLMQSKNVVNFLLIGLDAGNFNSVDDLQIESGVSKTVIEMLKSVGALSFLPDTNQMSFF